jgi:hypothetical protein
VRTGYVVADLLSGGQLRRSSESSGQIQGWTKKEHKIFGPQQVQLSGFREHLEITLRVTPLMPYTFVVVRPEKRKRWRRYKQESTRAQAFSYLSKDLQVLRDVLDDVEKEYYIPSLPGTEVEQIHLISAGEGTDHGAGKIQRST